MLEPTAFSVSIERVVLVLALQDVRRIGPVTKQEVGHLGGGKGLDAFRGHSLHQISLLKKPQL
jgi:hypothetical protein